MSRQYDAKQVALANHPKDKASGVDLFLQFLNISESDFKYEEGMTPEAYIYGASPLMQEK